MSQSSDPPQTHGSGQRRRGQRAGQARSETPSEAASQRSSLRWRRFVPILVGVVLLVLVVIGGQQELSRTRAALVDPRGDTRCRGAIGDRDAVQGRKAGAHALSPRTPDQIHQLAFGTSRQPEFASIEFTETGGPHRPSQINQVLRTQVSVFQRTDGRKLHNPTDQIWAQAIIGPRDRVNLLVCFDPGSGRRTIPGTYVGTVAIDDDSLREPAVASIQVTMKYPDMFGPLILVAFGGLLAIVLKAASDSTTAKTSDWLRQANNRSSLIYGGAALAAVFATYLRSGDWGANGLLDVGALFAASFAGFLAGLTAHQAGQNAGKGEAADQRPANKEAGR